MPRTPAAAVVRALLFLGFAGAATPALAQHVVTDDEAGKLTLDALTAAPAPVYHHVSFRPVAYHPWGHRAAFAPAMARGRYATAPVVREAAAWRRVVREPAHAAAHRHARRG